MEFVHALQVKDQAALAAIDLKVVIVLAARSEPRGIKGAQSTILEFDDHKGRVLDRYLPLAFTGSGSLERPGGHLIRQRAFYDEIGCHARDALDIPYQIPGQINAVRVQVPLGP